MVYNQFPIGFYIELDSLYPLGALNKHMYYSVGMVNPLWVSSQPRNGNFNAVDQSECASCPRESTMVSIWAMRRALHYVNCSVFSAVGGLNGGNGFVSSF